MQHPDERETAVNESYEAHRLIIRNMRVLEEAPAVIEEVTKAVFKRINGKIEKWVEAREGWEGVFSLNGYDDGGETAFQATKWGQTDDGTYVAYLDFTSRLERSCHWLSPLIGASEDQFGFFFNVLAVWITGNTGRKGARPGKAWTRYLADHLQDFPALTQCGFSLDGESLFLPVCLDADKLAEAFPDSLDDALPPIDEALEKITQILPELDQLIASAKAHFGSAESEASANPA